MTEKNDRLASADSELAQCEAEVGTLLRIIAELNVKMGALQIPREAKNYESQGQACTAVSSLNSSPPAPQPSPVVDTGTASVESVAKQGQLSEGGSGELWIRLQQVLSSLESSASRGRTLVEPYVHDDGKTQAEHITAARESWVQATQVLEEMERELGISYTSALPSEERQRYQKDVLSLDKLNRDLSANIQSHQDELKSAEGAILEMEEEKKKLREQLEELKRKWLIWASPSPPRSPSLSSSRTPSPCWSSPAFPGSPLLSRRLPVSPPASPSLPPRVHPSSSMLETETERLQRCLDRLKARNERLTAALDRRKSEQEQVSMALSRHEADCSALNMALAYCEECEEAYGDLLSLYEARKQQSAALAAPSPPEKPECLISVQEESVCTQVDTAESTQSSLPAEEFEDKTGVIRQRITRLKQDRAAVCIPEQTRTGEGKLSPDTGTLAGARRNSSASSNNPKGEKAALLYELVTVREEMSELRGLIRLKEKERRCLEFSLMAHRCQDAAGSAIAESLREELEDRRAEQQRIDENRAKLESGGGIPGPRNHAIMRELRAALLREQTLKRRVTSLRDSLDSALLDCTTQRRVSKEEVARLSLCNNKAMSAYRNARKKHHEQLWRLERQMTAMTERHAAQLAELKATLEALEWKREETVL
ncbi:colorectal mutant cancer protein isoform X1 [Colossoma macropomum]|uniref:colorectal mutant cancer protein isoform X1 n=1 Tax=Colossoma macropomum TaxID=42526 RepID=UPI001863EDC1|nr:colorectal mutant cancer protein isoform X1 [Colossoma macropomum]